MGAQTGGDVGKDVVSPGGSLVVGEYVDVSIIDSFVGFFDGLTRRRDTRGGHCR